MAGNYKKLTKGQGALTYSGSSALEFEHSFDPFNQHHFDQFQKNLSRLQDKVSLLSFMVGEVKEVLETAKKPSMHRTG